MLSHVTYFKFLGHHVEIDCKNASVDRWLSRPAAAKEDTPKRVAEVAVARSVDDGIQRRVRVASPEQSRDDGIGRVLASGTQRPCEVPGGKYNTTNIIQYTHTRLTALLPGLSGWAGIRKVKPIWILLKQETVSGSGNSWAICKIAPRSRQIATPVPHHSAFYRPDALPAAQPTESKHWRHIIQKTQPRRTYYYYIILYYTIIQII